MIELQVTGIDRAVERMRQGSVHFQRIVAEEMRHGASDILEAVQLPTFKHPSVPPVLARSGLSWSKINDWGVVSGAEFRAKSRSRNRAMYGEILQRGVDTTKLRKAWSQGRGRKKRTKPYKRGAFVIKPMPFMAEAIRRMGPTVEKQIAENVAARVAEVLSNGR